MPELKLNPDVREFEIGIRELRKVTIYPLSYRDQEKVTRIIKEGLSQFGDVATGKLSITDAAFTITDKGNLFTELVGFILSFVEEHLEEIILMVLPEEKDKTDIFAEITNNQMVAICDIIYEVNYSFLSKTVKGLMEKVFPKENQIEDGMMLSPKSPSVVATRLRDSMENPS